ncbi:MAG: hypothetical protein ACXW30_03440 [Micavibrio sp.]
MTDPKRVLIGVERPSGDSYRIAITVRDITPFTKIKDENLPQFQDKDGEALLAEILLAFKTQIAEVERLDLQGRCNDAPTGEPGSQLYNEDGIMIKQRRYRNGRLNDDVNGDPAYVEYDGNRVLRLVLHYKDGEYCDGINGEPTSTAYNPDGTLDAQERLRGDKYQDGPNGEPALTVYNRGVVDCVEHFTNGLLNDGVNGEPASQKFDGNGDLVAATRFSGGVEQKTLSAAEIAAFNAARKGRFRPGGPGPSPL